MTLNDVNGTIMWNLQPSGKVMNIEVECFNGILHLMNDGLKVGQLEQHHIILTKVMMSYFHRHCKVDLGDLFGTVNLIGL